MLRAASRVLAGADPPVGVTAVNNGLQAAADVVQVLRRLAIELIFATATGALSAEANAEPGDAPVAGFARLAAVAKALRMPCELVDVAAMFAPEVMNWDRAQAEAAVVTSL